MKVSGKVIVVTGAGNGMGREISLNLLNKEAKVIGLDINMEGLKQTQELAGNKGANMRLVQIDITNREMVEKAAEECIKLFGQVDGIVNNAGIIQDFISVNNMDYRMIERVMNINFYGTLYMVKEFLPHLLTRPQAHIVNVSSMGAFAPVPGQTFYGASKAAVRALTEGLMTELLDTNVEVSEVFPGAVATNIKQRSGIKDAKAVEEYSEEELRKQNVTLPKDAAEAIVSGMEAGKWKIIVGKDCKQMDLLMRIAPRFGMKKLSEAIKKLHNI
jgi:short-subunit dehydrogenase